MDDPRKKLQSLFDSLVSALLDEVQGEKPNAQVLNVARQLLKDNNIDAVAMPGSPIQNLASSLPFSGEADDSPPMRLVK